MASIKLAQKDCIERASRSAISFPELDASFVSTYAADVSAERARELTVWRIPKITAEGTCSRPGDLHPEPFDLLAAVYSRRGESAAAVSSASGEEPVVARAAVLHEVVRRIEEATGADWVGVYRVIESPPAALPHSAGERCLVKEAYRGAPSRPFFPLTPEFAAHSNNSTVAMTAQAILLPDTHKLGDEDPYYVCDAKVRSELCAPIVGRSGEVIGIIDAESFKPDHFTGSPEADDRTNFILAACARLGEADLLTHMLP